MHDVEVVFDRDKDDGWMEKDEMAMLGKAKPDSGSRLLIFTTPMLP